MLILKNYWHNKKAPKRALDLFFFEKIELHYLNAP
ncbi:MAG: hypothetical protein QG594_1320 [Bacteroidota bacterium]|nr:hypothetical protein [Bacteroidota bacterium]